LESRTGFLVEDDLSGDVSVSLSMDLGEKSRLIPGKRVVRLFRAKLGGGMS
jgi:hypothetical protein